MNKLISGGAWPDNDTSGACSYAEIPAIEAAQVRQPVNRTVVIVVRLALDQALQSEQAGIAADSYRGGWGWHGDGGGC